MAATLQAIPCLVHLLCRVYITHSVPHFLDEVYIVSSCPYLGDEVKKNGKKEVAGATKRA
eukprot:34480-Pelagomonas_calceolata.AAC.1